MLIFYFYIFQKGFEVLSATFQASVYVTTVTIAIYTTLRKFVDISLVVEWLIYSKKCCLI